MPRKKVNWELEWFKIHNPPEQFYFEFGKTVLLSNNLFHTPTVTTNRVLSTKVVEKIFDWESANKIPKKRNFEWLDIIKPIVDLLDIPKEKNKPLAQVFDFNKKKSVLGAYVVQVGAFSTQSNARRLKLQITQLGHNVSINNVESNGKRLYAVRVNRFKSKKKAESVGKDIKSKIGVEYRILYRPIGN
jgi:hypothetical protein